MLDGVLCSVHNGAATAAVCFWTGAVLRRVVVDRRCERAVVRRCKNPKPCIFCLEAGANQKPEKIRSNRSRTTRGNRERLFCTLLSACFVACSPNGFTSVHNTKDQCNLDQISNYKRIGFPHTTTTNRMNRPRFSPL